MIGRLVRRSARRALRSALRQRRRYRLTRRQRWYRDTYLDSPHWRHTRAQWWAAHPAARCGLCGGDSRPMDLHHVTYRRLGHERPSDLVPLHRACHQTIHQHRRRHPR